VIALLAGVRDGAHPGWRALLALALGAAALVCSRLAIVQSLHAIESTLATPLRPRHPVLICNPKSGGGKVDRFDIAAKARARGVEVIMLEPGSDLAGLAEDAVARGADCLGMAGGDGSQALVADIAVQHGIPFVCISAGTRNHFALDLGLDRADPSAGLVAFTDGVVRHVDYARVGQRLFVNNVSLGVYAQIVEQDSYRDAKLATAAETLPELLGRAGDPFDLQFDLPEDGPGGGREIDGSFVILVSNNPYVLGPMLDLAQRRSLTTGRLGVVAINARTGLEAAAVVTRAALGRAASDRNFHEFATASFQVRSRSGVANAGVDGEALTLPTPLDFTIHPRGLAVLVPPDNPVATAERHFRSFGIKGLVDIAKGRMPRT
jgi:diacylglycerol kinase family enzyme